MSDKRDWKQQLIEDGRKQESEKENEDESSVASHTRDQQRSPSIESLMEPPPERQSLDHPESILQKDDTSEWNHFETAKLCSSSALAPPSPLVHHDTLSSPSTPDLQGLDIHSPRSISRSPMRRSPLHSSPATLQTNLAPASLATASLATASLAPTMKESKTNTTMNTMSSVNTMSSGTKNTMSNGETPFLPVTVAENHRPMPPPAPASTSVQPSPPSSPLMYPLEPPSPSAASIKSLDHQKHGGRTSVKSTQQQILDYLRMDHQIRLQKDKLKHMEIERKQLQQALTESSRLLNFTKVDLNLNFLKPEVLAEIGGPGSIELKVRKRMRVGGAGSNGSISNSNENSETSIKEMLLYRLRQSNDPNPNQTFADWMNDYEIQRDTEPASIDVIRHHPHSKRLKVQHPTPARVSYMCNP